MELLYLAEDQQTCLYEVEALFGSPVEPISSPAKPWTCIPIEVYLQDIADLTDPAQAQLLFTNAQELTGDWRAFSTRKIPAAGVPSCHTGTPPTQELGAELHRVGFKGLISFSARRPTRKILVVFGENLTHPCWVRCSYEDDHGRAQLLQIP